MGIYLLSKSSAHEGSALWIFYSIKAFFQLLSAVLSDIFVLVFSCQLLGYFLFNLAIGLVTLVIFTVVAHRYKYRKRDDICNQYAEDY